MVFSPPFSNTGSAHFSLTRFNNHAAIPVEKWTYIIALELGVLLVFVIVIFRESNKKKVMQTFSEKNGAIMHTLTTMRQTVLYIEKKYNLKVYIYTNTEEQKIETLKVKKLPWMKFQF